MVSDGRKLTPKHIGLALTVHQATRSKELIQLLHAAGHCVSYDTVRRIDNSIANDTLKSYRDHGEIFIPRNFTPSSNLGYVRFSDDNIDINEETLSGMGTFHATQYAALRRKAPQEPTAQMQIELSSSRVLDLKVPSELHELQDAHMSTDNPEPTFQLTIPHAFYEPDKEQIKKAISLDMAWILSLQVNPDNQVIPGWSGFNQHIVKNNPPETEIHPLPIINAPAHDFDAIWTVMKRTEATTKQLQEKYTIITFDEQLYSKAKMLQLAKADNCEDFVIMLGGFHTQMNFSKVIGQYMESSGLTDIWVKSGIYGENTAENILKGKIWNRVIRAHKLTVDALWRILWPHFTLWVEQNGKVLDEKLTEFTSEIAEGFMQNDNDKIEASLDGFLCRVEQATALLEEFDKERCDNATFKYWRMYMHMVAILLRFTRAIRDGDWLLYLSAFAEMLPWFAAFDHVNYFRWGAIFLADMKLLQHTAPEVYQGFLNGDFVTKETSSRFNQISDDQALEHVNRVGKIAGGLIGITRTDSARDRWCLTYSERARLSESTKAMFGISNVADEDEETQHKDFGPKRMIRDETDVNELVDLFKHFNVFDRDSQDLISITTGDVAGADVKNDLLSAENIGMDLVNNFVEHRLISKTVKFHDRVTQRKLKTFENMYSVSVCVDKQRAVSIKADRDLFRRVIVALESGREVDIDTLLEHELSPVPLSLANIDQTLRYPMNKADLGKILEQGLAENQPPVNLESVCTIVDGMAVIQSLGNKSEAKTFGEWSDNFQKYVNSQFSESCKRVDIVFDRYQEMSVKEGTRVKRFRGKGKGIKCMVQSKDQKISSWDRFIALDENKASLVNFLCTELRSTHQSVANRELVLSGGFTDPKEAWSSTCRDTSNLSSIQEEADTCIILHAQDAKSSGFKQVNVICRDTDVLVLLVAHLPRLCEYVWMQAGTAKRKRYIPIHRIVISAETRMSLLACHAISGCDTTSQFVGIGKQTAWKVLLMCPQLLEQLGDDKIPTNQVLDDEEAFVCKLYDTSTPSRSIQEIRSASFRAKRSIDSLPPTQDAPHQHIRRAHYQTYIWKRAVEPCPYLPLPEDSGWLLAPDKNNLIPRLLTSEPVSAACLDLTTCGCSASERHCATRRCKCTKLNLSCTKACACKSMCGNPTALDNHDDGI